MSILAADVGGTNMRIAILDDDFKIIAEHRVEATLSSMQADTEKHAESMLTKLLCQSFEPFIKQYKPCRIGIGFPGFFDGNTGVLLASPNIPRLNNFNLAKAIEEATNVPTVVQNDALCAAWGEFRRGVGANQNVHSLMHITLGTGVGAGLILHGSPYAGEHGMAMEFGHLRLSPISNDDVHTCGCGNSGCLETYASATALSTRYNALTGNRITAQNVANKAMLGDPDAKLVIHRAGTYLGAAIAESSKLLDIKTISISGGMTGCWSLLFPAMNAALDTHIIQPLRGKVIIQKSMLGDHAGLLGAAYLSNDQTS